MVSVPQVWIDVERGGEQCFGCGQDNPVGLKLKFEWNGKLAVAEFTPTEVYQGWKGIVHGGIVACILDEAMGRPALFEGLRTVTAKMQVRLKRPAMIGVPLVISAHLTKKNRRLVESEAKVCLKDGTVVAEGSATHLIIKHRDWNNESGSGSDVPKQG